MRPFVLTLLFLTLAAAAPCKTNGAGSLSALFPNEADIYVSSTGVSRLEIPEQVLAACKPDLSDLRVFDRNGDEVPFVVHAGAPVGAPETREQAAAARILNVERNQVSRDNAPPLFRESYQVAMPGQLPEGESWEVEIRVSRARFVRTVRILAVEESGSVAEMVGNQSLFRLADGSEKTRIPLPAVSVPVLEIVIEGEEGSFLDPTFWFSSARRVKPVPPIIIVLREISRQWRRGQTVLFLARPGAVVPELLHIDTSAAWFDRPVQVWEEGLGVADRRLGSDRLWRRQDEISREHVEIRLDAARGQRLRIEITDGDSPPLADIAVAAFVPRPSLVWVAGAMASDGLAGTLRFGGGRAFLPAYDVTSLHLQDRDAGKSTDGDAGEAREDAVFAAARLGEIRSNPSYDDSPLLKFALRPGAEVDARLYRYRRPLLVEPSTEEVSRLHLAAADIARARPDLGDMRVVDEDGAQWPFLVDRNTPLQPLELDVARKPAQDHVSRYLIRPREILAVSELHLETDAGFVDRPYRLSATVPGATPVLVASGRLIREPYRAQPMVLKFAAVAAETFELAIDDGDNAPIDVLGVSTEVALPDLLLLAPRGQYFLLLGDVEATPPQYEIERVRQLVFAVDSGTVTGLELQDNPELSVAARLQRSGSASSTVQQVFVWSALVVAVAVLALITIRVVRGLATEGEDSQS